MRAVAPEIRGQPGKLAPGNRGAPGVVAGRTPTGIRKGLERLLIGPEKSRIALLVGESHWCPTALEAMLARLVCFGLWKAIARILLYHAPVRRCRVWIDTAARTESRHRKHVCQFTKTA